MSRLLNNAPLMECAFELHWKLTPSWTTSTGINASQLPLPPNAPAPFQTDPNYRIFLARMSDKLQKDYPNYVPLPQANMPDEMVPHIVQHRFHTETSLPVVQIGPGVLSVNHGPNYSWEDFKGRISRVLEMLYDSYPKPSELLLDNVSLKYIDGFPFDYDNQDALDFMRENLSAAFLVPESAFGTSVSRRASGLNLHLAFPTSQPEGTLNTSWATGVHDQQKKLIFQSTVTTPGPNIDFRNNSDTWLESAHEIIERWFFESLSGTLRKELLGHE